MGHTIRTSLVLLLSILWVAGAKASDFAKIDMMMYKAFSKEARQKAFLAELSVGEAKSKVMRAERHEKRTTALRNRNAVSEFEYIDALMQLIGAKFELERAKFHLEEFKEREKLWSFRASLTSETDEAKVRLAKGIARIYATRTKLLEELDRQLEPYMKLLDERFQRSKRLAASNAMSKAEFEDIETLKADIDGLAELSRAELKQSRLEAEEAEADVAAIK
ncbi:MAG: hypothetical protein R3B54_07145 [Bdellovibrionota bacterium]